MPEKTFIRLELSLKPKSRHNFPSSTSNKSDGLLERPIFLIHEVRNDKGGGLSETKLTLETPAEQCTSTLPYFTCFSIIL